MKTKFFASVCASVLVACAQQPGTPANPNRISPSSAQERGNGSDYIGAEAQTAWFTGLGKTFSYCLKMAPEFGVTKPEAERVIAEAIQMWGDYAKRKAPESQIVFSGKLQAQCSPSTDLVFELGGPAPLANSKGIQHLGAAIRKTYDETTRWSRGSIWIAAQNSVRLDEVDSSFSKVFPDWSEPNALRAVLLHELGHVFGNGHIELTIMDENLAHVLAFKYGGRSPDLDFRTEYRTKFLEGIDGFQEVLPSDSHVGTLGLPAEKRFEGACAGNENENFRLLTGAEPKGAIHSTFKVNGYKEYLLNISDSQDTYEFKLEMTNADLPSFSHVSVQWIFSELRNDGGYVWNNGKLRASGTRSLRLQTKTGQSLYLSYFENLQSVFGVLGRPFLEYVATGQVLVMHMAQGPRYLFISSLFQSAVSPEGLPNPRDRAPSCP